MLQEQTQVKITKKVLLYGNSILFAGLSSKLEQVHGLDVTQTEGDGDLGDLSKLDMIVVDLRDNKTSQLSAQVVYCAQCTAGGHGRDHQYADRANRPTSPNTFHAGCAGSAEKSDVISPHWVIRYITPRYFSEKYITWNYFFTYIQRRLLEPKKI